MIVRILFLVCCAFKIVLLAGKSSVLDQLTQHISYSLVWDRKQIPFIVKILIIITAYAAVIIILISVLKLSVQTSEKHRHTERNIIDNLYMSWSKDRSISKLPWLHFFREFASIRVMKYWALPFSLIEYLNKSKKNNKEEFMNYEWGRYESFKDFPLGSPAMPMRLASNGFFFLGTKDTVKCFSCKLKYSGWKEGDEPDALHKFLSPDCDFIKGIDSTNVPIHSTSESILNGCEYSTEGAVGGASYTIESHEKSSNSNLQVQQQSRQSHVSNDAMSSRHINHKFPDYENSQHRMDSFTKWPCADVITSRVLVEAGFFYAGFSDCVRCFSCGGGLRNWEYGDGPWEEHARWFPGCAFLREQKGPEFIRQHREVQADTDAEQDTSSTAIVSRQQALDTVKGNSLSENPSRHEDASPTKTSNDSSKRTTESLSTEKSMSIKSIEQILLPMGFSQADIRKSLERAGTEDARDSTITRLIDDLIEHSQANDKEQETEHTGKTLSTVVQEHVGNLATLKVQPTAVKHSLAELDSKVLQEENSRLIDQLTCKICMDKESNVVFIPCGHMVSCETCAPHIRKCAICRQLIKGRVKAFMS